MFGTFISSLICKQPPLAVPLNSAKYPIQPLGKGEGKGGAVGIRKEKPSDSPSGLLAGEMHLKSCWLIKDYPVKMQEEIKHDQGPLRCSFHNTLLTEATVKLQQLWKLHDLSKDLETFIGPQGRILKVN